MKKAIIVGASSGIGYQLAKNLAEADYLVGVTGRRLPLLLELKERMPSRIYAMQLDVCELNTIEAVLNELVSQLGGLDLLIISAGIGELNPALDFSIEKEMIDINVTGFTMIADWAFNHFARQQFGILAAITSIAALRGNRQSPAYSATKSYQAIYLEGLRQKAAHQHLKISVIDIRPGFVDTKMAKGEKIFWISPVRKACEQMINGIERRKSIIYITRRWQIIGWALKLLPGFIHRRL